MRKIIRQLNVLEKSADAAIVANMNYVWDGAEIIRSVDEVSGLSKNYFENGVEISGGASNNGKFFYTKDHLGSVREVVAASCDLQGRYDYSPFGKREILESLEGSFESDFGFTGHHFHKKSGLVLTLYRTYDPNLGRWLSADPLEMVTGNLAELLPEGANLYAYVGNDVVNTWDLDGLQVYVDPKNGNNNLRRNSKSGRYASKQDLANQVGKNLNPNRALSKPNLFSRICKFLSGKGKVPMPPINHNTAKGLLRLLYTGASIKTRTDYYDCIAKYGVGSPKCSKSKDCFDKARGAGVSVNEALSD